MCVGGGDVCVAGGNDVEGMLLDRFLCGLL